MDTLKIAAAVIRPIKGDPKGNAEKIKGFLKQAKEEGAKLVLFPECSLTSYAAEKAEELALPKDDPCIKDIETAADKLDISVCFGYVEKTPGAMYICQEYYCDHKKNAVPQDPSRI